MTKEKLQYDLAMLVAKSELDKYAPTEDECREKSRTPYDLKTELALSAFRHTYQILRDRYTEEAYDFLKDKTR